jgi:hypothetical protein
LGFRGFNFVALPGEKRWAFSLGGFFLFELDSKIGKMGKIGQDSVFVNKVRADLVPREARLYDEPILSYLISEPLVE